MATLLIVADCPDQRRLVQGLLAARTDHICEFADTIPAALDRLPGGGLDLLVIDLELPDTNGLQVLDTIKIADPDVPVLLMTAVGTEEAAVAALRRGAASYLPKRQLKNWLVDEVEGVLDRSRMAKSAADWPDEPARIEQYLLSNGLEEIPRLVRTLQRHLAEFGLGDRGRLMRVGIALEEALVNSVVHGNLELGSDLRGVDDEAYNRLVSERLAAEPFASRRVQVTASLDRHRALIVIRDEGRGFKVGELPDPTRPENMERAHGRGLLLIRTFFDEVEHNARGNEIRLVLRRCSDAVPSLMLQSA
jgi:CheY-like chemotaxis protein